MISRPTYLSAEERREMTVETVVDLAAEQNPADITVNAIAKRMGVTQGALFQHFSSKDAILQAVIEWVSERLLVRIDKATSIVTPLTRGFKMNYSKQTGASPMQFLEAMFAADVNFVVNHPNIPRLLLNAMGRTITSLLKLMMAKFIRRYEQRLSSVIAEAQQCSEIPPTLDREATVRLIIATIQHLVFRALIRDELDEIREAAPAAFASYRACVETTR